MNPVKKLPLPLRLTLQRSTWVRDSLARERGMGRGEWVFGQLVGVAITYLGLRAMRRHDLHEANHLIAAMIVGSSDHEGPCCVPHPYVIDQSAEIYYAGNAESNPNKGQQGG